MEDHHRYIDNLDKFEQVLLLIHSVHVPWGHKLMQKRNERKKKLVCGRNGNLKASSQTHRQSDMPKCHHLPKEKRKKKRKKRKPSQIFRKNLECVCCCVIHGPKRNKKKRFKRKVLPGFEPG